LNRSRTLDGGLNFAARLRMSGTKTEGQHGDLFPFGRRDGERWIGCKCLVVRIMKECHVVTHILGLIVIKQLSLQLLRALESREPIVFIVPPSLSDSLGTIFSLCPRQIF
jgi:hypothetical protein